jgi:hypothetical protein
VRHNIPDRKQGLLRLFDEDCCPDRLRRQRAQFIFMLDSRHLCATA